jgi:hypothetical protein
LRVGELGEPALGLGMHDPPDLEVGDDLFDDIADLVDLLVELLLPIQ